MRRTPIPSGLVQVPASGWRMLMRITALCVLAGLGVAACSSVPGDPGFAGHPLDCSLGFAHADCAPGTAGHRTAVAAREAVAARDANDDQRCRSYGLNYGSAGYAQCRMNIDNQRAALARAAIAASAAAKPPPPSRPLLPTTTNCQTYGTNIGGIIGGSTNCTTQ